MDWGTALSIALGGLLAVLGGTTTNRYARGRDAQAEMFILCAEMRLELGHAVRNYEVVYKDDNWVHFYRMSVLAGKRVLGLTQRIVVLERKRRSLLHEAGYKHDAGPLLSGLHQTLRPELSREILSD